MSRAAPALFVALIPGVFGSLGMFCTGPGGGPPSDDVCDTPTGGAVTRIQLGSFDGDDHLVPWGDGPVTVSSFVSGDQGSPMLVVGMRLHGEVPECLLQSIRVMDGDVLAGGNTAPLRSYPGPDGSRETRRIYVILRGSEPLPGDEFTVEASVGAFTMQQTVWNQTRPDAGVADAAGTD